MGQPTHFLPGRQIGMFVVTVPKEFTRAAAADVDDRRQRADDSIPLRLHPDYNVSPFTDVAIKNTPPAAALRRKGRRHPGADRATARRPQSRTTAVSTPLALTVWANDDAKYRERHDGARRASCRRRCELDVVEVSRPRHGDVRARPSRRWRSWPAARVNEPFRGKATTTARFSEPGEYVLHVIANDYSGEGGGGEVCCWTTALVKVTVTP